MPVICDSSAVYVFSVLSEGLSLTQTFAQVPLTLSVNIGSSTFGHTYYKALCIVYFYPPYQ